MNATVFDTHRIGKRLKEAGFSDIQAETRYGCAQREDLSDFVTKADLKTELAELRVAVFKSAVPLLPRQAALIGASVKLL